LGTYGKVIGGGGVCPLAQFPGIKHYMDAPGRWFLAVWRDNLATRVSGKLALSLPEHL